MAHTRWKTLEIYYKSENAQIRKMFFLETIENVSLNIATVFKVMFFDMVCREVRQTLIAEKIVLAKT